jgi:hypothetical protein
MEALTQIEEVVLYKFGYNPISLTNDFINIAPQTLEVNIFDSIFSPVVRAEIVVNDAIGLFTNFPLTGEEIVKISIKNDDYSRTEFFVIDLIKEIEISDDNRVATYNMNLVSMESWANARRTVQKAYNMPLMEAAGEIYNEYIIKELKKILPYYEPKPFNEGLSDESTKLTIIPNLNPFAAINMLAKLIEPAKDSPLTSYMFYQNVDGYHLKSLQEMFDDMRAYAQRKLAYENKYRYTSDDIPGNDKFSNDGRIVSNIVFNKRHSPLQKIQLGYFQNKLFEINIAQKGYHITETKPDEIERISAHRLNTTKYEALTPIFEGEEYSNRTRYAVTTQKENDLSFPVSERRNRWGRDLISHIAMSQIDLTITIDGNPDLKPGGLIYLEVAKAHGFNENEEDDLISGYFLITEKRDVVSQTGQYKSSLRIQKDSYESDVNRPSEYKVGVEKELFYF